MAILKIILTKTFIRNILQYTVNKDICGDLDGN